MCLGVPGKVVSIDPAIPEMPMGKVDFGGIVKEVCLAYVPQVQVGEYVVVHVGFAITQLDESQALQIFEYLQELDELEELETPQPN